MRPLSSFLSPLLLAGGAVLAAYAGYGAGLGRVAGAGLPHWLQVAAAALAGLGLFGYGLWRTSRSAAETAGSFSDDLAALERLVPTAGRHPDGLSALQRLVDVLFEARHRPEAARRTETLAEREGSRRA